MRRVFVDVQQKILFQTGIIGVDVGSTEKFFFLGEVLMKIISTDTFFFFFFKRGIVFAYCIGGVVIILQTYLHNFYHFFIFFIFYFTWDNFCLFYWRGSYFLTNVSSGKFFFWGEKWGRFIVHVSFFFLTSLFCFFFFFFDNMWGVFYAIE